MTVATAYLRSDFSGALDRAYEALSEAYQLDPNRYWKDLHKIAVMQGDIDKVRDLEKKYGPLTP